MENNKTALQKVTLKKSLTGKNRQFIALMVKGETLHDAYRKAGYKGKSYYAPYELKSYLKNEIRYALDASGINEESIMIATKNLLDLPLAPSEVAITVNQKLKIANSLFKMLPKEAEKKIQISPIIIQRGEGPTQINIGEKPKVDAVETTEAKSSGS